MFPKATHPLTPLQLEKAIAKRTASTVVLLEERVVGFANYHHCELGKMCAIGNVIVDPGCRGKGVGSYLIQTMIEIAFARYNAVEVEISCFNRNVAGMLLYEKLGFRPYSIEERQDKLWNRVALIHMRMDRPADL